MIWMLLIGMFVTAAAGAEILSRFALRRRGEYFVFPPGLRLHLTPDREVFPELERLVQFEVNRDGERGPEPPPARNGEKVYRVLVAGGSQPEGYVLDQPTCWPGALHAALDAAPARMLGAARVHVGSIARSGVGSAALDLILERVLPRYPRLDVIAILVGASDVLQWLEQGAPAAPPAPPRVHDLFMCHPEGPFRWTFEGSALVEQLRRWRRQWLRPVVFQPRAASWIGRARAMRARAAEIRETTADPSPMLDHFERALLRVVRRAQQHADRVIVIEQPWLDGPFTPDEAAHLWHGGAGQAWRSDLSTYYSFDVVSELVARLNRRSAAVARAAGAEYLELMPVLDGRLTHYYDGFHATPEGARRIARAVAAALLRRPARTGVDRSDVSALAVAG